MPIQFYIENCPDKSRLTELIEAHGGTVVSVPNPLSRQLVNPVTDYFLKRPYPLYSFKVIEDSVTLRSLQAFKDYELTQRLPQTRVKFTLADEEVMQSYQACHPGNPFSVLYWQEASDMGLVLGHSAGQLCEHWNAMNNRHQSTLRTALKKKQYSFLAKPVESIDVGSALKRPRRLAEAHKKLKDSLESTQEAVDYRPTFIVPGPDGLEVLDFSGLESKAQQARVAETFAKLVRACRKLGCSSESEILNTLVKLDGNIREVLTFYTANSG